MTDLPDKTILYYLKTIGHCFENSLSVYLSSHEEVDFGTCKLLVSYGAIFEPEKVNCQVWDELHFFLIFTVTK